MMKSESQSQSVSRAVQRYTVAIERWIRAIREEEDFALYPAQPLRNWTNGSVPTSPRKTPRGPSIMPETCRKLRFGSWISASETTGVCRFGRPHT